MKPHLWHLPKHFIEQVGKVSEAPRIPLVMVSLTINTKSMQYRIFTPLIFLLALVQYWMIDTWNPWRFTWKHWDNPSLNTFWQCQRVKKCLGALHRCNLNRCYVAVIDENLSQLFVAFLHCIPLWLKKIQKWKFKKTAQVTSFMEFNYIKKPWFVKVMKFKSRWIFLFRICEIKVEQKLVITS